MTNSWTETTLGEVIELYDHERIPLSTQKRSQRQGAYPYYGASGVIDYVDDYIFNGRFLLISEDGANLMDRKTPIAFFASGKFWVNNHAHVVRGIPKVADDYFLMSYIQSANISGYITGTAQPKLSQSNLKAIRLPLPPFPTQCKIAAVLSTYDNLIENNTRRIEILEEMAQAIYRQWFVEFRFPGHEGMEMVEAELGLIPQGWEVKQLGEVISEIIDYRGKTPKKLGGDWADSGIMALSAMNVKQGKLVNLEKAKFVSEQLYEKWMKSEIAKNDILMTSEAPLGEVYYLTEKRKICLSQRLYCIRANPNIIKPSLLFYAISSPAIQNQLHASATGTTVLGIRQAALRKISVIIPPLQLQSKAESVLETLTTIKETLEKKNTNLRQTRDLLLPKLISGEIDVSELQIDTDGIQPKKGGIHIPNSLKNRLHSDEKILGGKPVIRGTRLAVEFILELLEHGWSKEQVLENYPGIERKDIVACLAYQQKATDAPVSG